MRTCRNSAGDSFRCAMRIAEKSNQENIELTSPLTLTSHKELSIGMKEPHLCKVIIPQTITPPSLWTTDTRQAGSMDSLCRLHILTLPLPCSCKNESWIYQTRWVFCYFQLPSFHECVRQIPILHWQEWNPMLLLWPIHLKVKHVVSSDMLFAYHASKGYLSYCNLFDSLNRYSHQQGISTHRNMLIGCFLPVTTALISKFTGVCCFLPLCTGNPNGSMFYRWYFAHNKYRNKIKS